MDPISGYVQRHVEGSARERASAAEALAVLERMPSGRPVLEALVERGTTIRYESLPAGVGGMVRARDSNVVLLDDDMVRQPAASTAKTIAHEAVHVDQFHSPLGIASTLAATAGAIAWTAASATTLGMLDGSLHYRVPGAGILSSFLNAADAVSTAILEPPAYRAADQLMHEVGAPVSRLVYEDDGTQRSHLQVAADLVPYYRELEDVPQPDPWDMGTSNAVALLGSAAVTGAWLAVGQLTGFRHRWATAALALNGAITAFSAARLVTEGATKPLPDRSFFARRVVARGDGAATR